MRNGAIDGAVVAFGKVFEENVTKYGTGSAPTKAVLCWLEEYAESSEELDALRHLWWKTIGPARRAAEFDTETAHE